MEQIGVNKFLIFEIRHKNHRKHTYVVKCKKRNNFVSSHEFMQYCKDHLTKFSGKLHL